MRRRIPLLRSVRAAGCRIIRSRGIVDVGTLHKRLIVADVRVEALECDDTDISAGALGVGVCHHVEHAPLEGAFKRGQGNRHHDTEFCCLDL